MKLIVNEIFYSLQGEGGQSFADVSEGIWYQRYLAIAKEAGIVSGYASKIAFSFILKAFFLPEF